MLNGKHLKLSYQECVTSYETENDIYSSFYGYSFKVSEHEVSDSEGTLHITSYMATDSPNYTVVGDRYKIKIIGVRDVGAGYGLWSPIRSSIYNFSNPDNTYYCGGWGKWVFDTSGTAHSFTTSTATCTSAGVKKCSGCGYTETTPALGHNYSVLKSNATCTAAKVMKCSRCSSTTTSGSPLGHSKNNGTVTTNPTCTTTGVKTFNCSRCNAYMSQTTVASLGHNYTVNQKSATCTDAQILKCSRCTSTSTGQSALGHDWRDATLSSNNGVKIEPTVYNDGTYYQKCSRCSTGHSGDPYTNHFNVIPGTQKHFSIYVGDKRVQAIYIGNTPIMGANIGNNSLVA